MRKDNQKALLIVAVVIIILGLYSRGAFDKILVNAGLNAKPCYVSPLFGTHCGKEAEAIDQWKKELEKDSKQ